MDLEAPSGEHCVTALRKAAAPVTVVNDIAKVPGVSGVTENWEHGASPVIND